MPLSSKAGRKPASKGQKANIRFAKPTNDTDTSGADSDEDTGGGAPLYSPVLAARSTKSEVSAPTAKSKPVDDESPKSEGALRQPVASRASRLDPSSAAWEPRKNVEVDDKVSASHLRRSHLSSRSQTRLEAFFVLLLIHTSTFADRDCPG
jgi:hypothetical protein